MIKDIIFLILYVGFHVYFFYSLWLLLKKGADKLSWKDGFSFAISTNVVFHFWIKFFS
ncbi:MAG: hypothetical protein RL027_606 [Pseudomonadota bacterium]